MEAKTIAPNFIQLAQAFIEQEQLVIKIAASYYRRRLDDLLSFEDYKHYGFVGLLEAKQSYDTSYSASFATYATYRIRGAILNGVAKHSERASIYHYKVRAQRERLDSIRSDHDRQTNDLFDSFVELTESLTIAALLDDMSQADLSADLCSDTYYHSQLSSDLLAMIGELSENERAVIVYHYLGGLSFGEVSDTLQLSKGRISQLHKTALVKLKQQLQDKQHYDADL